MDGSEDEAGYTGGWRATAVGVCVTPVSGQLLATGSSTVDSVGAKRTIATCPAGSKIHSGGFDIGSGAGQVDLTTSFIDYDVAEQPDPTGLRSPAGKTNRYTGPLARGGLRHLRQLNRQAAPLLLPDHPPAGASIPGRPCQQRVDPGCQVDLGVPAEDAFGGGAVGGDVADVAQPIAPGDGRIRSAQRGGQASAISPIVVTRGEPMLSGVKPGGRFATVAATTALATSFTWTKLRRCRPSSKTWAG